MLLSFLTVKDKYSKPLIADRSFGGESNKIKNRYCVGGAFCLSLGLKVRFPSVFCLANQLFKIFDIEYGRATHIARHIIKNNDANEMPSAWRMLKQAYNFGARVGA